MKNKYYPNLASPFKVGNLTFKNRILGAPMSSPEMDPDSCMRKEDIAFHENRGRGGLSSVCLGLGIVDPDGRTHTKEVKLYEFPALIAKYAKGNWRALPQDKLYHVIGNHIEIETPEPIVVNVDGEALYSDHINFTLVPAAVNFIVPKGMKMFS